MRPIRRLGLLLALVLVLSIALPATALATTSGTIDGYWQGQGSATQTSAGVFAVTDSGVGVATGVGGFAAAASELDDFVTLTISDGNWTLTTPPGDTLTATYSGSFTLSPTTVAFHSSGQITGGSGRFAGATGTITFSGTGDLVTGHIIGSFVASLNG